MVFLKNAIAYKVLENKEKNEFGQITTTYTKDTEKISVCLQPIDQSIKNNTWGVEINADMQMFCDTILKIGDYVYIDTAYLIVSKNYNCYALSKADINV